MLVHMLAAIEVNIISSERNASSRNLLPVAFPFELLHLGFAVCNVAEVVTLSVLLRNALGLGQRLRSLSFDTGIRRRVRIHASRRIKEGMI